MIKRISIGLRHAVFLSLFALIYQPNIVTGTFPTSFGPINIPGLDGPSSWHCAIPSTQSIQNGFLAAMQGDLGRAGTIAASELKAIITRCLFGNTPQSRLITAAIYGNKEEVSELLAQIALNTAKKAANQLAQKTNSKTAAQASEVKNQGDMTLDNHSYSNSSAVILGTCALNNPRSYNDSVDQKDSKAQIKPETNGTALQLYDSSSDLDKSLMNEFGETPLHIVASKGSLDMMRTLLDKGLSIDKKDNTGLTPLMKASARGHTKVVQLLLDRGALTNIRDESGDTALMFASWAGHDEIVKELLAKDCALDIKKRDGFTALMLAARNGRFNIIKMLIEAGANINLQKEDGWTALMLAASNGRASIVEALIIHGADVTITDKKGLTAELHAKKAGYTGLSRSFELSLKQNAFKENLEEITQHLSPEEKAEYLQELLAAVQQPPEGPYQKSCDNSYVHENTLYADCRGPEGTEHTHLQLPCEFSIENDKGKLACLLVATALPAGPYRDSCNSCYAKDNVLHCVCKDLYKQEQKAQLALPCKGKISNNYGSLACT